MLRNGKKGEGEFNSNGATRGRLGGQIFTLLESSLARIGQTVGSDLVRRYKAIVVA